MPITGLSSVWYAVADWERSKQFYTEILGLDLEACSDDAGWAALRAGASATPFFLVKRLETGSDRAGAVVGFSAVDVGTLLVRIREFGCHVDDSVQEGPNVRIYTVYDPDGNPLELSEERQI